MAAVAEWEAEHGALTEEELAFADAKLDAWSADDLDEKRARVAGVACARSGLPDVIDAAVVVGALTRDDLVVTSDAKDLEQIAVSLGKRLKIHRI